MSKTADGETAPDHSITDEDRKRMAELLESNRALDNSHQERDEESGRFLSNDE